MEIYGLKQKKKKKWWLIPLIALAVILVFIMTVGIIVGTDSEEHKTISAAVSENADLKSQLAEKDEQIAALQEELEQTQNELAARPPAQTEAPTPSAPPSENDENENGGTSPRNYYE